MTPEAQNRAIALAMGLTPLCSYRLVGHEWSDWKTQEKPFPFLFRKCNKCAALHIHGQPLPTWDEDKVPPDFLNNLDAIHKAEMTLETGRGASDFCAELGSVILRRAGLRPDGPCGEWRKIHATASERAEAFVRVKGLWKE